MSMMTTFYLSSSCPFDFTSGFCWVEFTIYSTFPRGTVIVLYEIPSQNSKEHA